MSIRTNHVKLSDAVEKLFAHLIITFAWFCIRMFAIKIKSVIICDCVWKSRSHAYVRCGEGEKFSFRASFYVCLATFWHLLIKNVNMRGVWWRRFGNLPPHLHTHKNIELWLSNRSKLVQTLHVKLRWNKWYCECFNWVDFFFVNTQKQHLNISCFVEAKINYAGLF